MYFTGIMVGFEPIAYNAIETNNSIVLVCVQLFIDGALPAPLDVTLSTQPGTAMGKPLVTKIDFRFC